MKKSNMKNLILLLILAILFSPSHTFAQDTDTAWTRQTPGEDILDVKFSPDGNFIATAHEESHQILNANIRLWNVMDGSIVKVLPTNTHFVLSIAYSNDGKFLYSGHENGQLFKWDLNNFQISKDYLINYPQYKGDVFGICLDSLNSKLFIGTNKKDSNNIIVFDAQTGNIIKTINMPGSIGRMILSNDYKYFATRSSYFNTNDQTTHLQLTLWDAITYQKIKTLDDTQTEIWDIAFSSDGKSIFETQGYPYPSKIWSIPTGDLIKNYSPKQFKGINKQLYFKSSNKTFISYETTDLKPKFGIYDIENDNLESSYNIIMSVPKSLEISNDQTKIVCGMGDLIYLFNNKILEVGDQNPVQNTVSDIIIPNPLTIQALIKFNLPTSGITALNLLTESGIKIKSLFNSYLDAGNNEVSVNLLNIPSGNYLVSIQCTNYNKTLKLSIVK